MKKGGTFLAILSLILALGGVGIGGYLYFSTNNFQMVVDQYINEKNEYVLPMARAYYGGPFYSIPSGGALQLFDFNGLSFDTRGTFNLTSNAYIIPETGFYEVIAQYSIDADAGNFYVIALCKNNIVICSKSYTSSMNTNVFGVSLSDVNNFNEGDSVTIKAYQYNGGSLSRDVFNGEEYTFFTIVKVT